ncbi:hypothetical protein [Paenibacillus radicis (ex Gao et al. 2016)]|uniref:Uncharacterized protein n=1 Tax=Paenibacillus radicis (ex Gao et al. 2016) TaxID=1737354 RepID=A0A917GXP9_9BACL|nr:hypothetical protein [Paenibacillus radicis (ex Gao et al. 2016)]GGG60505.1 hypothetical protein GCM10010918_12250 [Paenibacillus radicis (ex Gao et al. 2016)]
MAKLELYYENKGIKRIPTCLLLKTESKEIDSTTNCLYFNYSEFELKHISNLKEDSKRITVEPEDIKNYRWDSGYLALSIPRIWGRLNSIMLKEKKTVLRLYEPTEFLLKIDDVNVVCNKEEREWLNI